MGGKDSTILHHFLGSDCWTVLLVVLLEVEEEEEEEEEDGEA